MKRHLRFCGLTLLTAATCGAASADAATILSDSFNRTAGMAGQAPPNGPGSSSWGQNDNASGGSTSQTYKVRSTPAGPSSEVQFVDGNFGRLRLGHGVVDFDLLSVPAIVQSGFKASFDFQRGGGGYVALALGITPTQIETHPQNNARIGVPFAANIPETDFGLLFRPSAATEVWKGGSTGVGPAGIFNATSFSGTPTTLLNTAVAEFTPAAPGQWGAGATINVTLNVNNAALPQYSSSFVSDGSGLGYFGFHSNAGGTVAQAAIDNLVIIANDIPEPSSLALLAAGCLAGIVVRRC